MSDRDVTALALEQAKEFCEKHAADVGYFGPSLVQRKLLIGYNQAARVIEQGIASGLFKLIPGMRFTVYIPGSLTKAGESQ